MCIRDSPTLRLPGGETSPSDRPPVGRSPHEQAARGENSPRTAARGEAFWARLERFPLPRRGHKFGAR
eukprot:4227810-Alexandrium_andersonii.AAC.1